MKGKIFWLFFITFAFIRCSALDGLGEELDKYSFMKRGRVIFSSPQMASIEQIHLETPMLLGREVIIEGEFHEGGRFNTHLVLTHKGSRLLIMTTQFDQDLDKNIAKSSSRQVKVLGTISSGDNGQPYMDAKALFISSL